MNHCVPDFEFQMDDDDEYPIPVSKKPSTQNDGIMELLWQNGQVVMQSQNQRPFRKPPPPPQQTQDSGGGAPVREIRSSDAENYKNQYLFMQEDEMTSWLHYLIHEDPPPLDQHDFCADMLYAAPVAAASQKHSSAAAQSSIFTAELGHPAPRPPVPPPRRPEQAPNRIHNFAKHGNASSSSKAAAQKPVVTADIARVNAAAGKTAASEGGRETATCDVTVTSSPGGSSGSAEPVVDRKRKGREPEESEFQSETISCHTFHMRWCWLSCAVGVTCVYVSTLPSIQINVYLISQSYNFRCVDMSSSVSFLYRNPKMRRGGIR